MMALFDSHIDSLSRIGRGKVRDIYAVDGDKMMIVVTDRLSAFDVVLPDPIPDKGRVLTELANFWFGRLGHVVPNHLTGIDPALRGPTCNWFFRSLFSPAMDPPPAPMDRVLIIVMPTIQRSITGRKS